MTELAPVSERPLTNVGSNEVGVQKATPYHFFQVRNIPPAAAAMAAVATQPISRMTLDTRVKLPMICLL